jgi:hypothetical protein
MRTRAALPAPGVTRAATSCRKPAAVNRILAESGHDIDAATVASSERGFDFSRVPVLSPSSERGIRVHTGPVAAAAAAAIDAEAFTVGSHIVVPTGTASPGSATFRHELAHAFQHLAGRSAGGNERMLEREAERAESGSLPSLPGVARASALPGDAPILRKPKPRRGPVENLALESKAPPDDTDDLANDLALMIALALTSPSQPKLLALRGRWPEAAKPIIEPQSGKPPRNALFPDLYDPEIVDKLKALSPDQRVALAGEVERRVITHLQSQPMNDLQAEFNQLNQTIKDELAGGFLGWVAMREGMFRCFIDIPQMNAYYASLVPAGFPSPKVKGYHTPVHPTMKQKLDRARELINKQPGLLKVVEDALSTSGLWATTIRENTARPSEIGSHAFGWAIDIEPGLNPDIRPFPEIFSDVIGADAGAGPSVVALQGPNVSRADAKKHAAILRKTSDDIVAAFANRGAVLDAIGRYLDRNGAGSLAPADRTQLGALVDAVTAADKKGKAAAVNALTAWVLARQDKVRALAAKSATDPEDVKSSSVAMVESPWVTQMSGALGSLIASKAELDARFAHIERQIDNPVGRAPADARKLGLGVLYDQQSVAALKKMNPAQKYEARNALYQNLSWLMHRTVATRTSARVLDIYEVFRSAIAQRSKDPQAHATTGQVAAHGWLSLPPDLIAALVSNEGAGLTWLGVMVSEKGGHKIGAKDSMHFELRAGDRPNLPAGRYPDMLRGGPSKTPGDFPSPEETDSA